MSLTVSQVYSVRFGNKLPLPKGVQDKIARLRITPAAYKPFRPARPLKHKPEPTENWRLKCLTSYVSKLKDKCDEDYSEIFGILNIINSQNLSMLSEKAITIISKRDSEFRLRVSALLFNKAITESLFGGIMADCTLKLSIAFPEFREDIRAQLNMFSKLYDINDTLVYPRDGEDDFDNKVIYWMKQKNTRRGYAKFTTHLYVRDLITEEFMAFTIESVLTELLESGSQPKSERTEENTTQYVDFLFESAKVLPDSKAIRSIISERIQKILAIPKTDIPSLCMRSRFRLEDTIKCVQ
jgi:hypothetical protein